MAKLYLYSQKYSILSIIVSNLPGKFTPAIIGVIVKFQEVSQFHEDSCSLQGTLEACSQVRLTMRTSVMAFQRSGSFVVLEMFPVEAGLETVYPLLHFLYHNFSVLQASTCE